MDDEYECIHFLTGECDGEDCDECEWDDEDWEELYQWVKQINTLEELKK